MFRQKGIANSESVDFCCLVLTTKNRIYFSPLGHLKKSKAIARLQVAPGRVLPLLTGDNTSIIWSCSAANANPAIDLSIDVQKTPER